jgi:phage head maturation protease
MKNLYFELRKSDDDERMVYGYASTEALDSDGEVISKEAMQGAWNEYMEYGNVREMHRPSAVGVVKEFNHDPLGTWIGAKVVDDKAWAKVKEGVYKGFSVGGKKTSQKGSTITGMRLSEISLVDRPANPDAKIEIWKAAAVNETDDVARLVRGLADAIQKHAGEETMSEEVEEVVEKAEDAPAVVEEVEKAEIASSDEINQEFIKAIASMTEQIQKLSDGNEALLKRIDELEAEPEAPKAALTAVAKGADVEVANETEEELDAVGLISKIHAAGGKRGLI